MFTASTRTVSACICAIALGGCLEQGKSTDNTANHTPTPDTIISTNIDYSRFVDKALVGCLQRQEMVATAQAQIINCPQQQIRSLEGIEQLSELRILSVPHNAIENVTPVSTLTQLHSLDINNNRVTSLDPVGKLSNLRTVSAKHNQLNDITGLKGSGIEKLYLDHNPLKNLDTLADMSKLKHVSAIGHQATIPQLAASVQSFKL